MKTFINWLTAIVYIENGSINERINIGAHDAILVLAEANKYHTSWTPVTRLQSWFK